MEGWNRSFFFFFFFWEYKLHACVNDVENLKLRKKLLNTVFFYKEIEASKYKMKTAYRIQNAE